MFGVHGPHRSSANGAHNLPFRDHTPPHPCLHTPLLPGASQAYLKRGQIVRHSRVGSAHPKLGSRESSDVMYASVNRDLNRLNRPSSSGSRPSYSRSSCSGGQLGGQGSSRGSLGWGTLSRGESMPVLTGPARKTLMNPLEGDGPLDLPSHFKVPAPRPDGCPMMP